MVSDKHDYDKPIEGHEYDGIEELDNPLPRWWLVTFYATIIFAVVYYGYFQLGPGASSDERLQAQMASIQEAQAGALAALQAADDIDVRAMLQDNSAMQIGAEEYQKNCIACHAEAGQGNIGPNLTDDYWLHSEGDVHGVLAAIRAGFPEKGMPPWGPLIPQDRHHALAVYVLSLRGSDPPNAKEPQGTLKERQQY